jgi:hypothetical protein
MKEKGQECYNKTLELDSARTNARKKLDELKKK